MKLVPILYVVIPCYNEEEVLPITLPIFKNKLKELILNHKISENSKLLLVNDGSKDNTWSLIKEYSNDKLVEGIAQSRNRGHQAAVWA